MNHIKYEKNMCTGCGACVQICPVEAIAYRVDDKGFFYPEVDEKKCINCGKCRKSCQLLQKKSTNEIIKAYALQINDNDILKDSTSGGAFSAIAKYVFENQGVVYGCLLNEEVHAVYGKAVDFDEIKTMRGSKYVWADASVCFKDIKKDLLKDKLVLFVGLPCQIEGLKLFLEKKYLKLITLDFLCGGPPSQLAFNEYIKTLTSKIKSKELDFKFRDKSHHGTGYCISYNKQGKRIYCTSEFSSYYYLFSNKLLQREACYKCRYRGIHRASDITMGDYWGIENIFPDLDSKAGVSFVISNTKEGEEILQALKTYCTMKETTIEDIAKKNIIRSDDSIKNLKIPMKREAFFKELNKRGWKIASIKYAWTYKRVKTIFVRYLKKIKREKR